MSKKHYHILVNYKEAKSGESHWWEECWLDCSPEETIREFNKTLRPNERARKLIDYEVLESSENKPHSWRKLNLVTQIVKGQLFDIYICEVCKATGKRFGLCGGITLDKKYKKKVYCI